MEALATQGHIKHRRGEAGAAEWFARAAAVLRRQLGDPTAELGSRPGWMCCEMLLDELEVAHAAGEDADQLQERVEELSRRLKGARAFHQKSHVARVSRGLDQLGFGRLAAICERGGLQPPWASRPAADLAYEELSAAIRTFRDNQHGWMLPLALLERAKLQGDLVEAAVNLEEARALALAMGLGAVLRRVGGGKLS
ncbi:MAG: hypothetical protein IPK80_27595 [Nannocystis sp.]|nr:hypothetical protein [Nannocystis sp.]